MSTARRFAAAATASLLTAGALFALLCSTSESRAKAGSGGCEEADIAFLASPVAPWKGAPLRVLFAAEKPLEGELSLIGPDGRVAANSRDAAGRAALFLVRRGIYPGRRHLAGEARATGDASAARHPRDRGARRRAAAAAQRGRSVWPVRDAWNRETENLYSAWIEKLFDAPLDEALSWPALHEVLRDQSRNFLFNHLGLGEDEMNMVIRPDCADLPYFLRAYFAFKMGLPYGFSKCSRGGGGKAPHCVAWSNILNAQTAAARRNAGAAARAPMRWRRSARVRRLPHRSGLGLAASFGQYLRSARRRRAFRIGPHGAERQQHRLLSRAADAGDAASGRGLCRSVRPRADAGEAHRADRGGRRRFPRRRRPA